MIDGSGTECLDFFSGILNTSIGHSHPEAEDRVCTDALERVGRAPHIVNESG